MVDGPRGVGQYAGHATAFPVGSARGATWDPDLEEQVGEAMGAEVRAKAGERAAGADHQHPAPSALGARPGDVRRGHGAPRPHGSRVRPRRAATRHRRREALRGQQHRGHALRRRRADRRAHAARGLPAALPRGRAGCPRRLGHVGVQLGERRALRRERPPAGRRPEAPTGASPASSSRTGSSGPQHRSLGACRDSTSRCRRATTTASR